MTKDKTKLFFVIQSSNMCWGKGERIEEATKACKKAGGRGKMHTTIFKAKSETATLQNFYEEINISFTNITWESENFMLIYQ